MTEGSPEDRLERWITAFRGPLVGLLASWGSDWRDAEELAQDVFAEAWLSRERFVGDPDATPAVGAWLRGIAFRLHATRLRRVTTRNAAPLDETVAFVSTEMDDERRAVLARAFGRLSETFQTVLRMYYLEETSAEEVGALLGISTKAAESRIERARTALRELVQHEMRRDPEGARR
jgi:RNA polymerase sigma factor (sigma-70 family)